MFLHGRRGAMPRPRATVEAHRPPRVPAGPHRRGALVYVRVQAEATHADQLADEADLRGNAVTTLAGDVRVLRAQIKAKGGTPAAPTQPRQSRTRPAGPRCQCRCRFPGRPGRRVTRATRARPHPRSPPRPAPPGRPDTRARRGNRVRTPPSPDSKDPRDPRASEANRGQPDGPSCPTATASRHPVGTDALVCRRDGAPDPSPTPTGLLGLATLATTASFRKL